MSKPRGSKRMQPLKPPSNISAFLSKLWRMVNDPDVDHLISWNEEGTCFVIQNQYQFWAELLPLYYKHNNMASFIRQLNMYGFHKVTSDTGIPDTDLQFYHEYFQRDNSDLLDRIKRKVAVPRGPVPTTSTTTTSAPNPPPTPPTPPVVNIPKNDLSRVLTDVKDIQGRQSSFDSQLTQLKLENSVLWSELAMLRQRHTKQQAIVNKLIHFLVTLVQTPNSASRMGVKRTFPLMIDQDVGRKKTKRSVGGRARARGLRIHELDPDISEAIDEDSVNTLETVTAQHSSPHKQYTQNAAQLSPETFLHSPEEFNNGTDDTDDVVIDESSTLVNDLLDPDEHEIITLPSEVKSPDGIPSTPNADIDGIVDEISNDDSDYFLNSTASNKLIANLMNGSYNSSAISDTLRSKLAACTVPSTSAVTSAPCAELASNYSPATATSSSAGSDNNLTVATMSKPPKPQRLKSVVSDELGQHVKETQSELDSIKDIIYGSNGMDLNYLLGLFEEPPFKMVPQQHSGNLDPSLSNTITTYEPMGSPLLPIDFGELMDAMTSDCDPLLSITAEEEGATATSTSTSINTPLIFEGAPTFPSTGKKDCEN